MNQILNNKRQDFILTMLCEIDKYGWTIEAMRNVSMNLQLHHDYYLTLFPLGVLDARSFYDEMLDHQMLQKLSNIPYPAKIKDRILLALVTRIVDLKDDYCKSPLTTTWSTADRIWKYAGDISTDHNYYTKRGMLCAVYVKAKKYYAHSHDKNSTINFITTELDSVLRLSGIKKYLAVENIPILRMIL